MTPDTLRRAATLLRARAEPDIDATPYAHWPPHGSERACHEGDCRRCELEQNKAEEEQT